MRGLATRKTQSVYALGALRADQERYLAQARRTWLSTLGDRGLSFDGGLTRPGALSLCRGGLGVSLPAESDISGEARRNTSGNLYTGKTTREGLR